jgi:4-amino-4-deoxy-L-arabinose transferase-like glycosyltransferase
MTPKHAVWTLIIGSALLRLISAFSLGLGNDEAYHFLYAAHPSLSYYDHPPMVAWVEMVGLALSGFEASAWALRIGFILLFAGSTWILARLTTRYYGASAGFLAALALNLSGYYGLAASTFALPDGPLLFFWLLTIDRLSIALDETQAGRLKPWIWVGLAWGGALLSKYHAVFIPLGTVLYVVLHRPKRRWLVQAGPYLAIVLGLVVFSPVIVWNASHGWVSFLFQGGRAVGGWIPRPDYLGKALLAQAGYLFPWIWIPLIVILIRDCRGWRRIDSDHERLLLCLAVVPLGVLTTVACFRPVLPHWGLIGFASLFPLLGRKWAARCKTRPETTRRFLFASACATVGILCLAIAEYRYGWLQRGGDNRWGLVDTSTDPTLDLYGWDQVADRITQLGLIDDPRTFVFARYWYQSAQLAYALDKKCPVLCYNAIDPRGFGFWSQPRDWVGRDGILVVVGGPDGQVRHYGHGFARIEQAADFWVERNGKPVRRIALYRCTQQRVAYPFGLDRTEMTARRNWDQDVAQERLSR